VVPEEIHTGEWPVPTEPGTEPLFWVRATVKVEDPKVAAFAVADLRTAVVQQVRTGLGAATSGEGSPPDPEQIASAIRQVIEPVLQRWGVSIEDVFVRTALR
jgi:regulator of protease activity HflC (stomatin/prohibitin superfamily)